MTKRLKKRPISTWNSEIPRNTASEALRLLIVSYRLVIRILDIYEIIVKKFIIQVVTPHWNKRRHMMKHDFTLYSIVCSFFLFYAFMRKFSPASQATINEASKVARKVFEMWRCDVTLMTFGNKREHRLTTLWNKYESLKHWVYILLNLPFEIVSLLGYILAMLYFGKPPESIK